jgi:Tol biopolymer transport system component
MPLKGGAEQRLTKDGRFIWGMAWANNREIVFGSTRSGTRAFWRITADGRSEPELVLGIQGEAMFPAIFRSAKGLSQLAYTRYTSDYNISKMEVNVDDRNAPRITTPPATVIASKANDHSPRLSPDGERIAFESDRSGYREIWVSSIDGANPVQLTTFQSSYTGAPAWSPDGQWIAFESVKAAKGDLYVVSAAGGAPKRLTTDRLDAARPNWSQDGRWIYFRANRGGRLQIWKISVGDPSQPAVQVTSDGWDAMESPDRKLLYFTKPESLGLWSVPLAGGPESRVIDAAFPGYWSIAENGIYFVDWMGRQASSKIQFFSFSSQKVVSIITIAKRIRYTAPGLSVTRDGRWIAWDQPDREEDDVMLLENFR